MKKITLLVACFIGFNVNAQSNLQLLDLDHGNANISANTVIQLTTKANLTTGFEIDIKNIGTTTNTYNLIRYDVLLYSTAIAHFCFAGGCYLETTFISPSPLVLRPGQLASDTTKKNAQATNYTILADLDEAATLGKSIVKYTLKNITKASDSIQVVFSYNGAVAPVGINTNEKANLSFDVYPNPASSFIELILGNNKFINSKATIYNALGAVVNEKIISSNEASSSIKFDVNALPSGIYFAKIENGNAVETRKFIVN